MGVERRILFEYHSSDGAFSAVCQEEDGIVIAVHSGVLEIDTARDLSRKYNEVQGQLGGKYLFFLDMTDVTNVSAEARIYVTKTMLGDDSPFKKWATMSGSFVLRTMVNMHAIIARLPIKDFSSKGEAFIWLKK